jgi:hypothetical protein
MIAGGQQGEVGGTDHAIAVHVRPPRLSKDSAIAVDVLAPNVTAAVPGASSPVAARIVALMSSRSLPCVRRMTSGTIHRVTIAERIALGLLAVLVAGAAGCWPQRISSNPNITIEGPEPQTADPDWEFLLAQTVNDDGMINYDLTDRLYRERLERTLARLSKSGPATAPEVFLLPEARTAYWINAYNALAYRAVLQRWPTDSAHRGLLPFEHAYLCRVDGEWMDLAGIRHRLDAVTSGELRARLCLCEMAHGGPPMMRQPIRPVTLEQQLDEQARRALRCPGVVRPDYGRKQLQVWRGIYRDRHRFVADYQRRYHAQHADLLDALLPLADPQRRWELNDAVGYPVVEMPFDGRLNVWQPSADGDADSEAPGVDSLSPAN